MEEKVTTHKETEGNTAYFSCGCFWGAEFYFRKAEGVISTTVGYMGGNKHNPTYEDVCRGDSGHLETTEIVFDPEIISYPELVKLFFEIHDFTQEDGQGPDIGKQYVSNIFYTDEYQKKIVEKYMELLKDMGYDVATTLKTAKETPFWKAENYHQDYYEKKGESPYCHFRRKIFPENT